MFIEQTQVRLPKRLTNFWGCNVKILDGTRLTSTTSYCTASCTANCTANCAVNLRDLYTESGQTLEGSFSAVSTATIARVGAFFRFFEIYKIFTPSHRWTQNFNKKLAKILHTFCKISLNFVQILLNFKTFSSEFHQNFIIFILFSSEIRNHPEPSRIPAVFSGNCMRPVRPLLASNCARLLVTNIFCHERDDHRDDADLGKRCDETIDRRQIYWEILCCG